MAGLVTLLPIILILLLLLNYYIAKQFQSIARDKGYIEDKYFHLCFWLGLVGYLMVIALPTREKERTSTSYKANRTL